jgi:hypothetical protein
MIEEILKGVREQSVFERVGVIARRCIERVFGDDPESIE